MADDDLDLTEVWTRALASLGDEGMTPQQRAFVSLTRPLAIVEDTALIAAPNEFTKDVLESKLRPLVVDALSRTLGRDVRIAVTVDPAIAPNLDEDATDEMADSTYADPVAMAPAPPKASPAARESVRPGTGSPGTRGEETSRLNPKYTFETFVIGSSNGSRTRPPSPSPSSRPRPTTRCSSTASPVWARPTCCTRSATTPARSTPGPRSAT